MKNKRILVSDSAAAKYVTGLSGWVDSYGHFFGENEQLAKWSGCTHIPCKCGEVYKKTGYCLPCHQKEQIKRFDNLEKREWDGVTPLYIEDDDEYIFEIDSLLEHIDERGGKLTDIRIRLCKPLPIEEVDADNLLDGQHDDAELPDDIAEALDALNKVISESDPITWIPDRYAAIVNELLEVENE